jgi:hypothetical protein
MIVDSGSPSKTKFPSKRVSHKSLPGYVCCCSIDFRFELYHPKKGSFFMFVVKLHDPNNFWNSIQRKSALSAGSYLPSNIFCSLHGLWQIIITMPYAMTALWTYPKTPDYVQLTKSILWRDRFPYLICFFWHEGVWELDVPLVVCPLRWFICLFGCGSFHFVPCIPPFFEYFGLFMIGSV